MERAEPTVLKRGMHVRTLIEKSLTIHSHHFFIKVSISKKKFVSLHHNSKYNSTFFLL